MFFIFNVITIIQIGRSPAQPDKVSVIGAHEKVEECIDYLLNLEEEYLQELAEKAEDDRYIPQKGQGGKSRGNKPHKSVSLLTIIFAFMVIYGCKIYSVNGHLWL